MLGLGLRGFTWGLFNELLGARVLPWQLQGQTLLLCRTVGWQQARVGAVEGVRKLSVPSHRHRRRPVRLRQAHA